MMLEFTANHVSQLFDDGSRKARRLNNLAVRQILKRQMLAYLTSCIKERKKYSPFYSMFTFVNN